MHNMSTSHRRAGSARLVRAEPEASSWWARIEEYHYTVATVVGAAVILVTESLVGGPFLVRLSSGVATIVLATSFVAWLSPAPSKRRWFTWTWLPLVALLVALALHS
jgi:hypothetical protein